MRKLSSVPHAAFAYRGSLGSGMNPHTRRSVRLPTCKHGSQLSEGRVSSWLQGRG